MPELYEQLERTDNMKLKLQSDQEFSVSFDRYEYTASDVVSRVMRFGEVIDFRMEEASIEHVIKAVYDGNLDLKQRDE
ncbi:hypothetical protein D3C73_1176120 [compost metagenome]